jgi:SAM-dependent methyltransferase
VQALVAMDTGGDWAERTYEAMAPVYDDFTAHHDNEVWIADLLEIVQRHGLQGRRLLDVGCGTGKSFIPMLSRDWEVVACDISPAMLALAREKAGEAVRLEVADMLALPRFGEFDLVWALDDAVNYLLSVEELESALAGMRANLAPHGLLLFDLNTLHAYRTFGAATEVVERGGRRLIWRGQASADMEPGSLWESQLEIIPDDEGAPAEEPAMLTHRQRHFPEEEVLAILARVGLEHLGVYGYGLDGPSSQPLDEGTHPKAVYVARDAGR